MAEKIECTLSGLRVAGKLLEAHEAYVGLVGQAGLDRIVFFRPSPNTSLSTALHELVNDRAQLELLRPRAVGVRVLQLFQELREMP